ncbi:MAG: hypothetical protein KA319_00930 [Ferruginibacter sp.]|nr:hypothetical protein [Ferruginibacter sp.]
MKKLFLLACIACASTVAIAQAKIVKYFNKLSAEHKHGYGITFKNGKYKVEADTESSIIVDDKNGYLIIEDAGTGGGTFVLELAIFKTAKGDDILAVNNYSYSGDGKDAGTVSFFDAKNNMADISMSVWPDMGYIEDLLHNGVTKSDIEPYADTEYGYCVLPRVGTTINYYIGFKKLDRECMENNKKACELQKKLTASKLVWNKEKILFELK